jgi:hypothetical protein
MSDFVQPFTNQSPVFDNDTVRHTQEISRDQSKPLTKIIKHMLKLRHPRTKRFTKTPRHRKSRKQSYYS